MTGRVQPAKAAFLAALMVLSVFAGTMAVTGATSDAGTSTLAAQQADVQVQNGSAKVFTLPWYRGVNEDASNGPYPVAPTEDGANSTVAIFTKAEGDGVIAADNSTARNPGGNWDFPVLHVETSGLSELNPNSSNPKKQGLVTQEFLENPDWNLTIQQVNGDKVLDVGANQENFEEAPTESAYPIPPVMVLADTEVVEGEHAIDGEPDTGLYVWIDPNRATLTQNGQEASFQPGETYEATFNIHGQTETVTFEMVEGTASLNESYNPANTFDASISGETTLSHSTEMKMVLEFENGDTMEETVEIEGNEVILSSAEVPGTVPTGTVEAVFDLSGQENRNFDVKLYAPGPVRNDDTYLNESNRVLVAESSGTVRDFIDPNYQIESANVTGPKTLSVPVGEDTGSPSAIAGTVGDGELAFDTSIARHKQQVDGQRVWQQAMFHFETSESVFPAIRRSPGRSAIEKLANSPITFQLVQENADGTPKRLNLSMNTTGVSLVLDQDRLDSRIYSSNNPGGLIFTVDPGSAVLFQDGQQAQIQPGENYTAVLRVETNQGTQELTTNVSFIQGETWFNVKGEQVELPQSRNAELNFKTTYGAAGEWTIEIDAKGHSFNKSVGAVPTGTGSVMAGKIAGSMPTAVSTITLDTSGIPIGTTLTINASIAEGPPNTPVRVLNTTAVIAPPPTANVSFSSQSGSGESVTVDQVGLSDGGFVSVHTGGPTGPTVGTSDYLEEGTYSDLEISLSEAITEDATVYVVVHLDTNGNEAFDFPVADDPYSSDGSAVTASAEYTVSSPTPTPTATATPTPTATATPTPTEAGPTPTEAGPTPTATETSGGGGPGFTVVMTVVGLLAAGLFVRRRR